MDINAIVYTSATGFTARYAALLAERPRLPAYELAQAGTALSKRAPVLYLGWLCAGGIKGLKKAAARFDVKAVCAVGMSAGGGGSVRRSRPGAVSRSRPRG